MVSSILFDVLGVLAALVVVLFVVPFLYARGKWLKCPNCGKVFKAPAMDQRTVGFGVSPPYLGRVPCPRCGQMQRRGKYQKVAGPTPEVPTSELQGPS